MTYTRLGAIQPGKWQEKLSATIPARIGGARGGWLGPVGGRTGSGVTDAAGTSPTRRGAEFQPIS